MTLAAFVGVGLGLQPLRHAVAANRSNEALRLACLGEIGGASGIVGKSALELRERTGEIGYGNLRRDDCALFVLRHPPPAITPYLVLPERGG